VAPDVNAYVNWGVGFETPTFIELAYRPVGSGLNFALQPAVSRSTEQLPHCTILPSIYHESEGYPADVTAIFDVGRGSLDVCRSGPGAGDIEDSLSTTFAHPSIAENQPLYQIDWQRSFPDAALVPHAKIKYSFEKPAPSSFERTGARPMFAKKKLRRRPPISRGASALTTTCGVRTS
jgi:hypothetical protein